MIHADKQTNSKMLAVALVAVLAVCCLGAMFSEADAADNNGKTYTLYMFEGESFTYTPETNLTDHVTISASGYEGSGLSWDGTTLSGTLTAAGTYDVLLTATWDLGDGTPTQSATQTIQFEVEDKPAFTGDSPANVYILSTGVQTGAENPIFTPVFNSSELADWQISGIVAAAPSGGSITDLAVSEVNGAVYATTSDLAIGDYTVNLTLTASNGDDGTPDSTGERQDFATLTVNIHVSDQLQLETDDGTEHNTYQGNTQDIVIAITDNSSDIQVDGDATPVYTPAGTSEYVTWDSELHQFVVDTESYSESFTSDYNTLEFSVTATLQVSSEVSTSDTLEFIVNVYRNLVFTTDPTAADSFASASSTNGLDMVLSSTFSGANRVVYDWGDGSFSDVRLNNNISETRYTADHSYAAAGTYMITVTAYNDVGKSTQIVMYNAGDYMDVGDGEDEEVLAIPGDDQTQGGSGGDDQGFFDEHGWQFILFAVLAFVLVALYFGFFGAGFTHPLVIVGALVCIVLAALCYVYCDLGGLFDEIGGLL